MKFTILLGLAFCLLAVHAQDETPEKEKSAVQKIIEASLAKIQKLFDSGIETLQAFLAKVFEKVDSAIESVNSCIESTKQAIKDIAAKGQKYLTCIEEQKPALKELEEKTASGIEACKKVADDKTKAVVDGLKNEGAAVQKEVGQVIAKCFEEHPFTSLLCATKEAAKTYAKAAISLPKSLLAAKSKITEISGEAAKCVEKVDEQAKSDSDNIQKQIEACANAA